MKDNMEILGWVSLDGQGRPHRRPKSNRYHAVNHLTLTSPPRIYKTQKRAESYSPVGKAKAVVLLGENNAN